MQRLFSRKRRSGSSGPDDGSPAPEERSGAPNVEVEKRGEEGRNDAVAPSKLPVPFSETGGDVAPEASPLPVFDGEGFCWC